MKKLILCVFFSLTLCRVHAENLFTWNFGNIGFGMNYSSENDDTLEFTVSVFNITFEQNSVGIEFNPVKYWQLFKFQNEMETIHNGKKFSFINTNIYWDLIKNSSVLFGPFASINYMYVNTSTGINMNDYIFSGGLCFSFKVSAIKYLSAEIGYRNINGKNKFYFSVNGDIIAVLIGIGSGMADNPKYNQKL